MENQPHSLPRTLLGEAMRIAVVGSGIGGLSAAWLLGERHSVTIYERRHRLGMTADTFGLRENGVRVDVPLRVFHAGYYPRMLALYAILGVETEAVNYASSFVDRSGRLHFRYRNLRLRGRSIPYMPPVDLRLPRACLIGLEALRLLLFSPAFEPPRGAESTEAYFKRKRFSTRFFDRFILPTMASICTCSYNAVRRIPADLVVDYLARSLRGGGVRRARRGAEDVVERLASRVAHVQTGAGVVRIERREDGVLVVDETGDAVHYDHVVIATHAQQALRMLEAEASERALLAAFSFERSRVVLHRDPRLAPRSPRTWGSVNFIVDPTASGPMATIWMNAVQPELAREKPLFQTWNPLFEPDPSTLLTEASFVRPVVDAASETALTELHKLHREPQRRVWFCGAWAARGIPLLETAVVSSLRVAHHLGVEVSW